MENYLKEIPNKISDASVLRKFVGNLYQGWGYNAYSRKEQLRADDIIIRTHVSELISELKRRWSKRETMWRKKSIPELTMENPFPDKEAIKVAISMQDIQKKLDFIKGIVTNSPVPSTDRIYIRYFNETENLERLKQADNSMISVLIKLISEANESKIDDFDTEELENTINDRKRLFLDINE